MSNSYGVSIKWLAVTSFEIRCGNTTVVTDPYITECVGTDLTWEAVEHCDIITLSHAHWDHVTDIPRLSQRFDPCILCGELTATPLARWLPCPASRVYPMSSNLELDFGDVRIRALFGRHGIQKTNLTAMTELICSNPLCVADPGLAALQEVGSIEYRNFLFTLPNGTRILIWGNPPSVEQVNQCRALAPDIAILQRPSGPERTIKMADFAAAIGCKVVIPHHHDFKKVDDPAEVAQFKQAFLERVPDGTFITPVHGQWVDL